MYFTRKNSRLNWKNKNTEYVKLLFSSNQRVLCKLETFSIIYFANLQRKDGGNSENLKSYSKDRQFTGFSDHKTFRHARTFE